MWQEYANTKPMEIKSNKKLTKLTLRKTQKLRNQIPTKKTYKNTNLTQVNVIKAKLKQ
jgi:hypothetical protein